MSIEQPLDQFYYMAPGESTRSQPVPGLEKDFRQWYPAPSPWIGAGIFLPPVILPPYPVLPFWI
ncbi:MAG: hypothetical protein QJR06_10525 [Alicyclobacillaceae bacterium]|nr:hypothetical protein [Alicyclobacillaceae bacterium]